MPVIHNAENRGYAAAHNQALALTDSRYVLTLNPDVSLDPLFLAAITLPLDANPAIGSASGCLLRVESLTDIPTTVDSTGLYVRRSRRQGLLNEGLPVESRPTRIMAIFGPDGAAAFYRREMLEDIRVAGEIFDEDFFVHKEDVDVCWRSLLRGWKAVHVPDALAKHIRTFRPGQRAQVMRGVRFRALRNRYLIMLKNDSLRLFLCHLPNIALYDMAILAYLIAREPALLPALLIQPSLILRMLKKRQYIQATRRVPLSELSRWFVWGSINEHHQTPWTGDS